MIRHHIKTITLSSSIAIIDKYKVGYIPHGVLFDHLEIKYPSQGIKGGSILYIFDDEYSGGRYITINKISERNRI